MTEDMKMTIAETVAEMIKTRDLDRLTVTSLVEECHISRQTFYYHFHDINDVIEYLVSANIASIAKECLEFTNLYDAIHHLVNALSDDRQLLKRALSSQRRADIERMLVESTKAALESVYDELGITAHIDGSGDTVLDFFTYGSVGFRIYGDLRSHEDIDIVTGRIFNVIKSYMDLEQK